MKKYFLVFIALLSLGLVSCGSDNDSSDGKEETTETNKALGGGVYLIDGHRFIDLHLPSGILWSETNLGGKNDADIGTCYCWSTTKPNTAPADKYNETDGKYTLDEEDDAAYVNWGSSCRMPSEKEMLELIDKENCTISWVSRVNSEGNVTPGILIASKRNSQKIFLPAVINGDDNKDSGFSTHGFSGAYVTCCGYWSNSANYERMDDDHALCIWFSQSSYYRMPSMDIDPRSWQFPIRCVAEKP